jgi:hypothetical protein
MKGNSLHFAIEHFSKLKREFKVPDLSEVVKVFQDNYTNRK